MDFQLYKSSVAGVLLDKVLRKVFVPKQEEVQEAGGGSIMRTFMISASEQILLR